MNERIPFPLNKRPIVTGRNKGFVWNIFPRDEKRASSRKDIWGNGTKSFPTSQNKRFIVKINLH